MVAVHEPLGGDVDGVRFNDDAVQMGLQAATHWDALAHVSYAGRMYNGCPTSARHEAGPRGCGAERIGAVVGRGVLLDVARAAGVTRLDGGVALTRCGSGPRPRSSARVTVGEGDIVLAAYRADAAVAGRRQVGLRDQHGRTVDADGASGSTRARSRRWRPTTCRSRCFPARSDGLCLPVHMLHIVEMGLLQGQNFDLEELADGLRDGRPLRVHAGRRHRSRSSAPAARPSCRSP